MTSKKVAPHPTDIGSGPDRTGPEESQVVENNLDGGVENDDSKDRVGDEENMEKGQVEEKVAAEDGKEVDDDVTPPPRRGSIAEYIRRASIGAALEVGVQLGAIAPDTDDVKGEAGRNNRPQTSIAVIDNPISFWRHTFTTNVQGLASALPACLLILVMTFVNKNLVKLGGFFGDMHVVRCFGCLLYVDGILLVIRWDRAYTKKMLLCKVPGQITFMVAVSSAFGWKLGPWMNLVATFAFSFGEMCTYIIDMQEQPRPPVIKYMVSYLVTGFLLHGIVVFLINALVIPTRLLAKWKNALITMITTGLVFPFVIFLVRKVIVSWLQKWIAGKEGWSDEKKVETLTMTVTMFSTMILITPSVLLYFNVSVKYALFSAFCQLFTEVGGKIWTVWATKKRLTFFRKDDDNIDYEELERERLALLAIRYHGEIVAEKGCIVVACEIAFLNFQDQVNTSSTDLILIGVVFYALEMITDCIFVWVMHNKLGVPILSAVPHSNLCSASNLRAQALLFLAFQTQANCIAMASSVQM
ncbi:hypothetical protein TrRE_jg4069 [Triparma retinervis]|uniref:Uncharacterized protein n=1 Tax=Triparma retinervis TaxID=2557542 RepID=A0A9W6ZX15_9STRA|nr:hypothetical protein TrRE_jg4069 [Triparma retinervis]